MSLIQLKFISFFFSKIVAKQRNPTSKEKRLFINNRNLASTIRPNAADDVLMVSKRKRREVGHLRGGRRREKDKTSSFIDCYILMNYVNDFFKFYQRRRRHGINSRLLGVRHGLRGRRNHLGRLGRRNRHEEVLRVRDRRIHALFRRSRVRVLRDRLARAEWRTCRVRRRRRASS